MCIRDSLMNEYSEDGLLERINAAERAVVHPLRMVAADVSGGVHRALAFNEVSPAARESAGGKVSGQRRRGRADR